jgi:hypothetical protein
MRLRRDGREEEEEGEGTGQQRERTHVAREKPNRDDGIGSWRARARARMCGVHYVKATFKLKVEKVEIPRHFNPLVEFSILFP